MFQHSEPISMVDIDPMNIVLTNSTVARSQLL